MLRWILTIDGFNTQPKIYAPTAKQAAKVFSKEKVVDVKPYNDMSYLQYIDNLKSKSELLATKNCVNNTVKELYRHNLDNGTLLFKLGKDLNDSLYFDITEYQFKSNDSLIYPVLFTYSNPKSVVEKFLTPSMTCEIYFYRVWGEPKLDRPAELKGIKESFSVDWIVNKCKCQCFIKDNDLWIKHRDFFSRIFRPPDGDIGKPLIYIAKKYFDYNRKKEFVYPDCWGCVVLRNEAWIVFRNIKQAVNRDKALPINSMLKTFSDTTLLRKSGIKQSDLGFDWRNFFEIVIKEYVKTLK